MNTDQRYNHILEIIKLAGGQSALASLCGGKVRQPHVFNWLHRDKKIPAKHALKIEKFCIDNGRPDLNRHVIAPEVFGSIEQNSKERTINA